VLIQKIVTIAEQNLDRRRSWPDAPAVYAQALRVGATSIETPQDKPYGDRAAGVKDAWGNSWFIATHLGR